VFQGGEDAEFYRDLRTAAPEIVLVTNAAMNGSCELNQVVWGVCEGPEIPTGSSRSSKT
jgi:hypothetical protein